MLLVLVGFVCCVFFFCRVVGFCVFEGCFQVCVSFWEAFVEVLGF